MDLDSILSEYKGTAKSKPSGLDIDAILSDFKASPAEALPKNIKKVIINTDPRPPISGISKDASDELNQTRTERFGVENPRRSLPTTNIQESIIKDYTAGKEMASSGISDIASSNPASGVGKTALGVFQMGTAPITGAVEGGIVTPIADITGSKSIGDKAGMVVSTAIPVVPGGAAIVKTMPKNKAFRNLVENIGPENLPATVAAMKANPRLGPADLSPRVLQDAQHLFTSDGPQIDYLAKTSAARMASAKDSVNTAFDASMGATVNAAQKIDELKKAAQEIGKKNIEPVLAAKPHTDITSLIKDIDTAIGHPAMKAIKEGKAPPLPLTPYQRELLDVRNKLRSTDWPDRSQMFAYTDQLHDAQIALRESASALSKSATGSERHTGKQLLEFREKMKDAVGKEYKEALAKYAGQKKVEEAFHYGHDKILKNSVNDLENDPSFFKKWVDSSSRKPGELEAAREGARLRINAEINGTRSAATNPASRGTAIGQNDFNAQRLEILLGKDEAEKLLTKLEHTRMEANTHNKIVEGSQTAMRSASKSQFTLPYKTQVMKSTPAVAAAEASSYFMGGMPGAGAAMLGVAKAGAMVKDAISLKLAKEHNAQYAKLALPTEGPSRDALIVALEAQIPGPKQSLLTRGAGTLSRLVGP